MFVIGNTKSSEWEILGIPDLDCQVVSENIRMFKFQEVTLEIYFPDWLNNVSLKSIIISLSLA
jgi:hypothetical protein